MYTFLKISPGILVSFCWFQINYKSNNYLNIITNLLDVLIVICYASQSRKFHFFGTSSLVIYKVIARRLRPLIVEEYLLGHRTSVYTDLSEGPPSCLFNTYDKSGILTTYSGRDVDELSRGTSEKKRWRQIDNNSW